MPNRRFTRIHFESKAIVRTTLELPFEVFTENLSMNGLFIRTASRLPVGNWVEIMLEIPSASSNSSFTVNAKVVRNDVHGMAFQFGPLDQESFSRLQTVINRKSPNRLKEHYSA